MINRFARAASAVAVGAIFVGVLPGVASAAAAPVVAVTPPVAFNSGATTPTPFKADLTGADATESTVSVRFRLSGPKALDAADVLLEAFDATAKTWSPVTFTDIDERTVSATYGSAGIVLPAGATVPVDFRVKIADPIVDGPVTLNTEMVNTADGAVLHTDNDELDVTGVPAPQLTVTEIAPVESGKYVPFTTEATNAGAEIYGALVKIEAKVETMPAGTKLFLQREHPWAQGYWYDIPMSETAGVFTTSNTYDIFGQNELYTDQPVTGKWRLAASDPSVLGKLTVTAALVDQDELSTVHDTAATVGSFTPSTVDMAVDFTGFDTVLKSGTPIQGAISVVNNHATDAFTGQARFVLDGGGLQSHEISATVEDPANPGKQPVYFNNVSGKIVGSFPVSDLAAGAQLNRTVEITLNDNSRDGAVKLDVGVAAEKTTFARKLGTLQLQATTTVPQTEGVEFYGSTKGRAVVSWKGSTDPNISYDVRVVGEASDYAGVNSRNPNSRFVYMPAGLPVTVAVRTVQYDPATDNAMRSVPVFKTYTAPAAALPTPSDIQITPDDSDDRLDEMITWKGSSDYYRVIVTDTKTRYRHRDWTSIAQVLLSNVLGSDREPGRTYSISVASVDDATGNVGKAATFTYTTRAPEAPAAKLASVRGANVVSWKHDPRSLYSVLVNNKAIPFTGSSVDVDRYLVSGANTVKVTAENAYGSEVSDLTVQTSKVTAAVSARKVVFGGSVRLTGAISSTPLAGRSVQVQQYDAAKKVWNGSVTVKTDAKGKFAVSVKPSRSTSYRVALLAAGQSAGSVSRAAGVSVAPKTSLTVSDASVRTGDTVTLTAKPAGAVAGTTVTFQQLVGKTWKSFKSVKVAKGAASAKVKLTKKGTASFRVAVAGTSATAAATSGTVKVTAK